MRWNLQNKLLLPVLLLITLGIGSITYISVVLARDAMRGLLEEEMQLLSEGLARDVETWIHNVMRQVEVNAQRADFKAVVMENAGNEAAIHKVNAELIALKKAYGFVHIAILSLDGTLRASSNPDKIGKVNFADRGYFKAALKGQNALSKVLRGRLVNGIPVVVLATPMRDGNKVVGVTFVSQILSEFNERHITPIRIGKEGHSYMLDKDGTIIAHPETALILEKNISEYAFGKQMMAQKQGVMKYSWKGREVIAHITPVPSTQWIVGVRGYTDDIYSPLIHIRYYIIATGILTLLLLSILLYTRTRKMTQPLITINDYLKQRLALGHPVEIDIDYVDDDEIGEILTSVRTLRNSIHSTIKQAKAIAEGDFSQKIKLLSENDQLGRSLSDMTITLREVVEQANAIAQGDYSREVKLLSKHDQLGQALAHMTLRLREMTEQNTAENWLKTGLAELNTRISGEQDLAQLGRNIINFLAEYLEAQVGAFYCIEQPVSGDLLVLTASHAYIPSEEKSRFKLGEGVLGQAAYEQKTIILDKLPSHYLCIESGLGKVEPQTVLIMPMMYEGHLKGMIELASIHTFTSSHQNFLEQSMSSMAIAVNTAESRAQMRQLLEKNQDILD